MTMLGIIGGSGLYDMPDLVGDWRRVESPWGTPSDDLFVGRLGEMPIAFLPRHGRAHALPPSRINYRANIDALKRTGVTDVISLSAVGSLKEDLSPGTFVIVDQFIDRTIAREKTFFEAGCVAHVSMADPVCPRLGEHLEAGCRALDISFATKATYLAMEGPQFSSRAESMLYRQWGCDILGMTNMPEAKLAREAELCYASVGMVTDYDCWRSEDAAVDVTDILAVLRDNADKARSLVRVLAEELSLDRALCFAGCDRALDHAVITSPTARSPELVAKLDAVAGRVL